MKNIVLSASDPGGANTLLPIISRLPEEFNLLTIVGGASRDLFKKAGLKFVDGDELTTLELEKLVKDFNPDVFVAGTSFGYTIDKKIFELVKGKTKTLYILDFWSNYWQRFSSDGVRDFKYLPDVISVMDDFAKEEMMKEGFNPKIIEVTGNPHFDSFIDSIDSKIQEKRRILFASQPYSGKDVATNFGYDEFSVLGDLLKVLSDFDDYKLIIRPHPKENPAKFDEIIKSNKNVFLDDDLDVKISISRADLIIGMNSMILLQSALAGKNVISYQPGLPIEKDILISNKTGLSKLITDSVILRENIGNYFAGNGVIIENNGNSGKLELIRNAGDKVIKLIKSYV